ncbi:MAG TPA: TonB family protein [Steroidobacteraceae bacterium]|nr:TonB family protein [Steroidobacteraceae bacterium]
MSVQSATRKNESAAPETGDRVYAPAAKRAKLSVLLVTRDDMLWPQIGPHISGQLILKQLDTIDELLSATPSGQPAIVLWDARNQTDAAAVLSRLQLHSPCFAILALDEPGNASAWANPIALRQVVAHLGVPVQADSLRSSLDIAHEEVNARTALLGDASAAAAAAAPADRRPIPWIPAGIGLGVLIACAGAYVLLRGNDTPPQPAHTQAQAPAPVQSPSVKPEPQKPGAAPAAVTDEKVDLLVEKAQQAMLDRHFIDPAEGSALTLYRNALLLDPENGEARQGLQRLAEILFARVQSALDERKFDIALQSLETARSINPSDGRLAPLDARIATLRAELGPAQILAAINAQNFDRAAQLIDEATRSKSLSNVKLNQLRDELRRRHDENDIANFVKLIDTRLQQDKLIEPRNDSATFYLNQARAAGASVAALQSQTQEINKRLSQTVHAAIDGKHFAEADRLIADLHNFGVPPAAITGLQHDLTVARAQSAAAVPEQPQYLELAQSRLAQGKVTEPDTDSALFYVAQLRAADPKNSALPKISSAVQAQILEQARAALDATQPAKAESLLQMAGSLGASPDVDALNARLVQVKAVSAGGMPEVMEASLTRAKAIELNYPADALRRNVEGWVELAYVIAADGKVSQVKVLNSSPPGVFDASAVKTISRVRYKPTLQGGKPIAVTTKIRIAYRMAK